ncbi:MAG: hypothetical protein CMG03_01490, partial [Candidatus Marinimicrobia bacterium]|nr:hypothetical protein [Candidatus Neomarinimicrobiota bacterium]
SGLISDSPVDLFVIITPIKICPEKYYQEGIAIGCFEDKRSNDGELKAPYNYFGGLKAQQALVQKGEYDEALYVSNNQILEGTTFSFFIIKNDIVTTTKLDGRILGSVTRKNLLRLMDYYQINHCESKITIEDLKTSSEAFIASANRDLIPVVSIDNHKIGDGIIGPKYKQLMELYQKEIYNITI